MYYQACLSGKLVEQGRWSVITDGDFKQVVLNAGSTAECRGPATLGDQLFGAKAGCITSTMLTHVPAGAHFGGYLSNQ